ncbi:hypothetical protein DFH27DRAFT_653645 [Peziza echinospora]|nr:hypothetical protein DFH27DRAFT_653645 [Peziza echinospora]
MDPPPPPIPRRLAHLAHYARKSHLAAHKPTTTRARTRPTHGVHPREDDASAHAAYHTALLTETARLRALIAQELEAISKLPHPPPPPPQSTPTTAQLNHLLTLRHTLTTHQTSLPSHLPHLPPPPSPLPTLLLHNHLLTALTTLQTHTLPTLRHTLTLLTHKLTTQHTHLTSSHALTTTLRNRIEDLTNQLHLRGLSSASTTSQLPDEANVAKHILATTTALVTRYSKAQRYLLRGMARFIDSQHVGKMVAAEAGGGAVVGEDLDPTLSLSRRAGREKGQRDIKEMLTSHSEEKSKPSSSGKRRKRDNDEDGGNSDADEEEQEPDLTPTTAATNELKSLIEALMNAAVSVSSSAGGSSIDAYIPVDAGTSTSTSTSTPQQRRRGPADSAAARFLVRAGVAQFHPRDARRIKLVNFGRAVED